MDKKKITIVQAIDPDDISRIKESQARQKEDEIETIANDLDIPGSELDDEMEAIGNEDEENNYYSLGGERHHNLEETK